MAKKEAKAGGLYLFGNIFDKAVAFITVPIFTRMLSTSDYGYTTTYLSWVNILTVIITLSLGNSIRSAVVDYKGKEDEYLSSVFFLGTLSALAITGILSIVALVSSDSLPLPIILLCCADSYAVSILATVKWRYMMEMKYVRRTILQSLPNILIVIIAVIFISNMEHEKYLGRIYANTIVSFALALFYVLIYFSRGRTFFNKVYWKYALSFSLPLIFHSLSNVILSPADRSMITWLKNSSETGIYGIAYQFGMVPLVITTTLENVWIPWFTKKMECGEKNLVNEMVRPYVSVVTIICTGVILVAPEVLKFMTTPDYYSAIYIIAPVTLANFFMFLASISIDNEYYLKKTKTIAINTVIAAVVNIILNYIYIPKFGAVAAAYTTVASYFVSFVMHYIYTKRLDKDLFSLKTYFPSILCIGLFTCLSYVLMPYPIVRWVIGIALGILLLTYGKRFLAIK